MGFARIAQPALNHHKICTSALVLVRSKELPGCYRRVGTSSWDDEKKAKKKELDVFGQAEVTTITLA